MRQNTPLSKQPVQKNEGFTCKNCGEINPKAEKSCRNHCRKCLFSLHVDLHAPGDRLNQCNGLMEPIGIGQNSKKGHQIIHKCLKCGAEKTNMVAPDDNTDEIIKIMNKQNIRHGAERSVPRAKAKRKHGQSKYHK